MRVMIIDNDTAWTRSLELILSQRGYEVVVFNDPVAACQYIDENYNTRPAEMPDAVLLDYAMPRMSGFQVLTRIRDELPASGRVVFVTGHGDQIAHADLQQMGVDAWLAKPVEIDELTAVLEHGRTCGNAA